MSAWPTTRKLGDAARTRYVGKCVTDVGDVMHRARGLDALCRIGALLLCLVVAIIDGDTIKVRCSEEPARAVRLA